MVHWRYSIEDLKREIKNVKDYAQIAIGKSIGKTKTFKNLENNF